MATSLMTKFDKIFLKNFPVQNRTDYFFSIQNAFG